MTTNNPWYRIPELPIGVFLKAVKPIYNIIEGNHVKTTLEDPFKKTILASLITEEEWDTAEKTRVKEKALEMKMGEMHQCIMGNLPGYQDLGVGHETKCDVLSTTRKEAIEVKNKYNTMNSDSSKTVMSKLMKASDEGYTGILVLVNTKDTVPRFGFPKQILVWNGKQAYAHMSGRDSFYDDLIHTIEYAFRMFRSFEELKRGTASAVHPSPLQV
jgi:hypothetical protein